MAKKKGGKTPAVVEGKGKAGEGQKVERKAFSRAKLVLALKTVSAATDKVSDVLQGSDSFVFGSGYVRTFNNQMAFSLPVPGLDIECTVRADETLKVLERMVGNDVFLSRTEDSLEVSDGRTRLRMRFLGEDGDIRSVMKGMALEEISWEPLPEDFLRGLKLCSYSMWDDSSSMAMISGVQVADGFLWSSDNLRIGRYRMKEKFEGKFTVPREAVHVLTRLGEVKEWGRSATGWVCFRTPDGVVFSTAELYEDFPLDHLKEILEGKDSAETNAEFPETLAKSLGVVSVMPTEFEDVDLPVVAMWRDGGKLHLKGEKDFGSVEDEVDFSGEFPSGRIFVSPDLLKDVLGVTRRFRYDAEGNCIVFRTDDFLHVMTVLSGEDK